jgi:transposase
VSTTRLQLLRFTGQLPPCRIGMEACGGAHQLARELTGQGHDARLMPAQYVRPYVKTHKNDHRDAEAIAEAVQRGLRCASCRSSGVKSLEQRDVQVVHRHRQRLVRSSCLAHQPAARHHLRARPHNGEGEDGAAKAGGGGARRRVGDRADTDAAAGDP